VPTAVNHYTLVDPGAQTNYDGDVVAVTVATVGGGDATTTAASGLPSGLTLSGGSISGTVASTADAGSPYTVTVTVTDVITSTTTSETINWTVNQPTVTLTSPGDQSNFDGDAVNVPLSAADSAGHTLTYTATNLPDGLSVDSSTGVISGIVSCDSDTQGTDSVTLTATDNSANVSATQTINWAVTPVIVLVQGDQYNNDGDTVSVSDYFWDTASSDSVTYSATGLPTGLSINSSSGAISGTIAYGDSASSPYSVTITATDTTAGTSTSAGFTWNISPLTVSFTEMGTEANLPGDSVSDAPVYASTSDGSALTFSASGLPAGLSIDSSTGTISGTISSGAASGSPYDVTVTATQSSASISVTQAVEWTVASMYLENPGDQTNIPGDSVDQTFTAADGAGGSPTFSATGLPAGLSIDSGTGEISGTVSTSAISSTPYSVMVTEADGATSVSQSFQWNVQPIALSSPVSVFNTDGDHVRVPISISAPAGDSISFSASGLPSGLSINATTGTIHGKMASNADASGPYSVTVTATDTTTSASTNETFTWTVAQAGQAGPNLTPAQENNLGYLLNLQTILGTRILNARYVQIPSYQSKVATDRANIASTIGLIIANGSSPALSSALTGYVNNLNSDLSQLSYWQNQLRITTGPYNQVTEAIDRLRSGR
jgi:large repetitive protein